MLSPAEKASRKKLGLGLGDEHGRGAEPICYSLEDSGAKDEVLLNEKPRHRFNVSTYSTVHTLCVSVLSEFGRQAARDVK